MITHENITDDTIKGFRDLAEREGRAQLAVLCDQALGNLGHSAELVAFARACVAGELNRRAYAPKSIIDRQLAGAIDEPLDIATRVKCDNAGQRNCIDPQLEVRNGKAIGWNSLDPRKMCGSCACYWHLSCARNFALGVVR